MFIGGGFLHSAGLGDSGGGFLFMAVKSNVLATQLSLKKLFF